MAKIAYVIGKRGAGKGHLAEQFANSATVIEIDSLLRRAATRLCPFVKGDCVWKWELWRVLLSHAHVQPAIQYALTDTLVTDLGTGRPIVAEGSILWMDNFRQVFAQALRECAVTLSEERVFWLDPPAEEVLKHIKQRNLPNERHYDLELLRRELLSYRKHAHNHSSSRFEDAALAKAAVEEFLGVPSNV